MTGRGVIYAHLFENPGAGISRSLFWNLFIDLKPHGQKDDDAIHAVLCEWLTFTVRDWMQLGGISLANCQQPNIVECSFYQSNEHHLAHLDSLSFQETNKADCFRLNLSLHALPQKEYASPVTLDVECDARFDGFIVVPANLSPVPKTPEEASKVLDRFVDLRSVCTPFWDRFSFVFRPALGQETV